MNISQTTATPINPNSNTKFTWTETINIRGVLKRKIQEYLGIIPKVWTEASQLLPKNFHVTLCITYQLRQELLKL